MTGVPTYIQDYLKKREARNSLPMLAMGIWAGSFIMALYSDTLLTFDGGLGRGGKGNLAFVVVLAAFYVWRKSVLTRQMNVLLSSFKPEDRDLLLREIVG
jgi:hypothetical protein